MRELSTKSCEEIMSTIYKPTQFAVEGLIAQGLFILAGSPKLGKSWLALELCLSIAKGKMLLGCKTQQGSALYFCLEDSYQRIQSRLYELTDESSDKLFFALKAESIGNGLEEQIVKFKSEHDDLRLVVIDTFQMVRKETESSYGGDYAELLPLKALAEQLGMSIVLVHHLRKAADSDPFNMVSGSTGLNGCVDGLLVLLKDKPPDLFPFAIHDLMAERCSFKGSATELCGLLKSEFGVEYFANRLTRDLFRHAYELRSYGVSFEMKRSNGQRLLLLSYDKNSDSSDGKKLTPDTDNFTDPTVTCGADKCPEKSENTLKDDGRCSERQPKATDPIAGSTVPDGQTADPEYLIVDGKRVPIIKMSLDEIINRSAAKIRNKIATEQGIQVPEFKLAL